MNFWLIYLVFFLPVAIKEVIFWTFLWQNKEYRGDKMLDYLSLPESKKVIFNIWTLLRLAGIVFFSISLIFNLEITAIIYLILGVWICEFLVFISKFFLKKKLLFPKFTSKATALFTLSVLSIFLIPFLFYNPEVVDEWFLFLISFISLSIPFLVGYWALILFPFDYYTKNKLFQSAKKYRDSLGNLEVIAISGAYGKTTTKEILAYFLENTTKKNSQSNYLTAKTIKNQNSNISCARQTLKLDPKSDFFLCELGAYSRGDGSEICQFIHPNSSIITGLNYQHFSLFGSEENIILTESESINFLKPGSLLILNWSSPMCRKINLRPDLKVIKCGIEAENNLEDDFDYFAKNIVFDGKATAFKLVNHGETYDLETNLLTKGSVQNILHSIAYCWESGIEIPNLKKLLKNIPTIPGRAEVIKKDWGQIIYNQYNNSDGVRNLVELISQTKTNKIILFDDIMELGKKSFDEHNEIAKEIASANPAKIVLLGRNYSNIVNNSLVEMKFKPENILFWNEKNTNLIKKQLRANISKSKLETTVLLMGYQSKNFLDL